ncbi:Pfs NACHT and Ankyrin domain protein [Penicillium macrosclerotiorum]|uniref:Pfs NACHT and Ankyrin domain protein n=1 Tax=Penicillium macrosclerotiorum TaxID=303699 RepID=UPI0025473AD3|nr:Pfs NACHT and Ankyrin domain protein [Penicillium macrosclerotiorum]KAJ5678667.1 Pfs NACHT and Ankyrin domain protein [Penicillium macrosclerotiorum]
MTSNSFSGPNNGAQIAVNYGPINHGLATEASSGRRLCLRDLFITNPKEDKNALKRKKGRHAAGTCEWILRTEELNAWLGSGLTVGPERQTAQVLWLHGPPGTGKSMMAVYLAENLPTGLSTADGETLVYFFCDSGFDTRKTATSVIRGLLYQLVERHEKLYDYLLPKYNTRGAELFTSFDALWDIFIAMIADPITGRTYCIIDALDECDRESQNLLLQQLEESFQSQKVSPHLRILVTSRPYSEIRETLQSFPNKDLATFPQRQKDMDLFIDEKINDLAERKNYTEKIKTQIREIFREKSEGTFLWIGLAYEELKDIPSHRVIRALQSMPQGLIKLYTKLLEMALEQSELSADEIRHLLICVALSSRPLTVSELSEACQLHLDEDDRDTRLQFTYEYIESCRLMIIVQDKKVLLLHKSIKDYLVGDSSKHFIQKSEGHALLAYRSIDLLIRQFHSENRPYTPFLDYAAQEWANHARMAESNFKVHSPQAEFFQLDSPCREWWLQQIRKWPLYGLKRIPTRFSIFHVAAEWGICALLDPGTELGARGTDEEKSTCAVHVNCKDDSGMTPLECAARSGYPNVVIALLNWGGRVTRQVLKAAARNRESGKDMMALLLHRYGDQITITDEVLKATARNRESGKDMMALLLHRYGDQITITDEVLKAAASNWESGPDVIGLLLDRYGDQITITDEVLKATARNRESGKDMMALLLDRYGDQITITDEVLKAAASNWESGPDVIGLLLDRYGDQITITDKVLKAAASNSQSGPEVIALLLDRYGDQITITDEVLKAAASNWESGPDVIGLLLDRYGDQITITDEVVEAAASNWESGPDVIGLLLDRYGDQITITDEVVEAAASNWESGKDMMALLLDRYGDQITITDEVLRAAARNRESGKDVMALLLHRYGDQITITDKVVEAAAGNKDFMTLLLDRRDHLITFTDRAKVVKAATGN